MAHFQHPSTAEPIDESRLLELVCLATHGAPLKGARDEVNLMFFRSMGRFREMQERNGESTITRQSLRLWQDGAKPKRANALEFLHRYLRWSRSKDESTHQWDEERQRVGRELDEWFANKQINETKGSLQERAFGLPPLDPDISLAFQQLFNISRNSRQSEEEAFFRGAQTDTDDRSYYLMYRYSTNHGDILKSFVVLQKPSPRIRRSYKFNHFVWGGRSPGSMSHIFRECEGFILKLARSFYFVGYNYIVPVDKRTDAALYQIERVKAKWSPNGMGVLAFEYDGILTSPGLFSGLTLTLAALGQPVAARVAMLHLGTRRSFGRDIDDIIAQPAEITVPELASDLRKTIERLQEAGCRRFGLTLEEYIKDSEWKVKGAELIASRILDMVDNSPAWQGPRSRGLKNSQKKIAAGALETFGSGRPRD